MQTAPSRDRLEGVLGNGIQIPNVLPKVQVWFAANKGMFDRDKWQLTHFSKLAANCANASQEHAGGQQLGRNGSCLMGSQR